MKLRCSDLFGRRIAILSALGACMIGLALSGTIAAQDAPPDTTPAASDGAAAGDASAKDDEDSKPDGADAGNAVVVVDGGVAGAAVRVEIGMQALVPANLVPANIVVNADAGMVVIGPQAPGDANRTETAQRWLRGFIQNELNAIERIVQPSPEQAQALVNLAEREWKNRLASVMRSYAENQNQRLTVDFDTRVERLVQAWVRDTFPVDQQQRWQREIDARFELRKRIVIGRMVGEAERRYGLTHAQMVEVSELLRARWKDAWWSMYRSGALPESKFSWISSVLSDSQRTLGGDRSTQFSEHFMGGGVVDMPSHGIRERFHINTITSSEDIPLQKVAPPADTEVEPPAKEVPLGIDGPVEEVLK